MRAFLLLLLPAAAAAAPADDYFELGVAYLKRGFYTRATHAFAESLVRAPGQPVPTLFAGVSVAAGGRAPRQAAVLLRKGLLGLREDARLALDLRTQLPSAKALALVHARARRELKKARGNDARALLEVLAFLEVFDGDPKGAPSLRRLHELRPKDPYVARLCGINRRAGGAACSPPTTPPTSSGSDGAPAGSSSGRS